MPDPELTLVTFGALELRDGGGRPVSLKSRKARALLAILATQRGLRMSRARLASLLWADRGEAQARGSLRQVLSELRRVLGPDASDIVRAAGETVELDGARVTCDVVRFERLLDRGDRASLEAAVEIQGGPFLEGFDLREDAFDEWRVPERRRLESRLLTGLERLAQVCEADGELEAALGHVDRVIAISPLREEAHRRGMALCRRLDRTTEALERFERLRSRLAADLDVAPQSESLDLYEAIRTAREESVRGVDAAAAPDPLQRHRSADGRPSVAVMPFVNLSGDPEQEFFADGMMEDIVTELSRFRGLLVIARNSTFVYKGRVVDSRELARELGVKYLLEGSVRAGGDRLRVSAQLIDAERRSHVWAERYDRDPRDLFSLQDEIVRTLVAAVGPELDDAERREATRASADQLDAWGAYHRGMWHVYRFTKEDTTQALAFFRKAIEAAPTDARGWTGSAFAHFSNAFLGFVEDRAAERRRCLEAARRAVELDTRDAAAHWALGRAHSLERDYDRAIAELETAVDLNGNHAQAWYQLGWVRVRAGRPEEALEPLILAERLSPNDPLRFAFLIARAQAHFALEEYAQAVTLADRAAHLPHAHAQIEAVRIACLVKDGQIEAARGAIATFRTAHPEFDAALFAEAHGFAREDDLAPYLDALAEAGLPS